MNLIKRITKKPYRVYKYCKDKKTTAKNPQHNDVYVVEFPKSGISWLCSLLSNIALIESGRKEIANFTSTGLYIPDIHVCRDISNVAYDKPPVRFIKSHAEFNQNYVFLIYLVRHPVDVMKSYYRFLFESGYDVDSFDSFIRSGMGVLAWKRHINSWLTGKVIAQRLHLCKYEDMIENPYFELRNIFENFGWDVSDHTIHESIKRSSISTMKSSEETFRNRNPRYTMNFVRGGTLQAEEKSIQYIKYHCKNEIKMLNYD